MKVELSLQCPYKVSLNQNSNTYSFTSNGGAKYNILFELENDIFSETVLATGKVYHVVVAKAEKGDGKKDTDNITETVHAIIDHFFEVKERILIYTCDSDDGRHYARKKIFDTWYNKSELNRVLIKYDGSIETEDFVYLSSIIFHQENPIGAANINEAFGFTVEMLQEGK